MTRSLWKGPFSEIFTSIYDLNGAGSSLQSKDEIPQKVWSRRSVILPQFIGKQFIIHNGKTFIPLKVTPDMVGHKMGEFATTRKKAIHKKKIKKNKLLFYIVFCSFLHSKKDKKQQVSFLAKRTE